MSLCAGAQEQDSIPVTSVVKVDLTQKVTLDDVVDVEFVKVVSDSRCPKNVQCIWAGEAKVVVKLYRNGKFEKEVQFTISPNAIEKTVLEMFSSTEIQIKGINLLPYPDASIEASLKDYYLEFTR